MDSKEQVELLLNEQEDNQDISDDVYILNSWWIFHERMMPLVRHSLTDAAQIAQCSIQRP